MVRARGAGLAGMSGRLGGFLGVGVVLAGLAPPSLAGAATLGAVPIGFAALAVTRHGLETRRRRLEEISAPRWLNQDARFTPFSCAFTGTDVSDFRSTVC